MHFTDEHPKTARFFNTVAEQEDELGCSRQNEPMQARGKQTQTQPHGKATRDATNDSTETSAILPRDEPRSQDRDETVKRKSYPAKKVMSLGKHGSRQNLGGWTESMFAATAGRLQSLSGLCTDEGLWAVCLNRGLMNSPLGSLLRLNGLLLPRLRLIPHGLWLGGSEEVGRCGAGVIDVGLVNWRLTDRSEM